MTTLPAPSQSAVETVLDNAPNFSLFGASSNDEKQTVLGDFIALIYATDFVAPFDWMTAFPKDDPRWNDVDFLKNADAALVREVLIAHLRLDRFSSGHLERIMTSGYLEAVLSRLRVLFAVKP